jgi:flagellar basal body-associated protein FliL
MKRSTLIILLVVLVLFAAGIAFLFRSGGVDKAKQEVTEKVQEGVVNAVSMECTFTDSQGRETKAYIKNGAVRSDYTSPNVQESGSVLLKDKVLYVWTAQKQGFMMNISTDTEAVNNLDPQTAPALFQMEEMMKNVNKDKNNCKPATTSDTLFVVPTDVVFTDYSQMKKQLQTISGVPSINPTQMQQLMQQKSQQ